MCERERKQIKSKLSKAKQSTAKQIPRGGRVTCYPVRGYDDDDDEDDDDDDDDDEDDDDADDGNGDDQ